MHGETIDWVVLNTVQGGLDLPTGETHLGGPIRNYLTYKFEKSLEFQPIYEKILDIGSLDINGTMREYYFLHPGHKKWKEYVGYKEYIGIDLIEGPSVDIVMDSNNMTLEENSFDLILTLSQLEHDNNPTETLKGAYKVLKPGGTLLVACPTEKTDEHKFLGGGNKEVHNRITSKMLKLWLINAGFKINNFITTDIDHLVNATK